MDGLQDGGPNSSPGNTLMISAPASIPATTSGDAHGAWHTGHTVSVAYTNSVGIEVWAHYILCAGEMAIRAVSESITVPAPMMKSVLSYSFAIFSIMALTPGVV